MNIDSDKLLCSDMRSFYTKLEQLRKSDDIIIVALNNELPTKSFPGCEKSRKTCEDFLLKAKNLEQSRIALIDRCLAYNNNLLQMVAEHDQRQIRGLVRQISSQKDVEDIVNTRTNKAIMERCNRIV